MAMCYSCQACNQCESCVTCQIRVCDRRFEYLEEEGADIEDFLKDLKAKRRGMSWLIWLLWCILTFKWLKITTKKVEKS